MIERVVDDNIRQQWQAASSGERLHHAWLLAGGRGLGKSAFADEAAIGLLKGTSDVDLRNNPDILRIRALPKDEKEAKKQEAGEPFERKRNITIAQIRTMQRRLTTRPTTGARRAIIIDPADELERSASNALLKSLEEPPSGTFFLLVSHHPARLLPTILSRCRQLRFLPETDKTILRALALEQPDAPPDDIAAAVKWANGSRGYARQFLELQLAPVGQAIETMLDHGDPIGREGGDLVQCIGAQAGRDRIRAIIELASRIVGFYALAQSPPYFDRLLAVHHELVQLVQKHDTYNYDNGFVIMHLANLLGSVAPDRKLAHG